MGKIVLVFKGSARGRSCNIVVVGASRRVQVFVLVTVKHIDRILLALSCGRNVCRQALLELDWVVVGRVNHAEVVLWN